METQNDDDVKWDEETNDPRVIDLCNEEDDTNKVFIPTPLELDDEEDIDLKCDGPEDDVDMNNLDAV